MESFQKVLGLPWGGCSQKTSKLEAPRRHPVQMPKPPQMAPFDTEEQWLHSELPLNVRAHHSIFEAEPSHPTEPFGSASPWWTQYCWRHSKLSISHCPNVWSWYCSTSHTGLHPHLIDTANSFSSNFCRYRDNIVLVNFFVCYNCQADNLIAWLQVSQKHLINL